MKKSTENKNTLYFILLLLLTLSSSIQSQSLVGTAFNYQGELIDNGSPANGEYDILIEPFTVETGGSGIPFTFNTFSNVSVINGLFTLQNVNFGDVIYSNSQAIWLQISIRKSSEGGNYTALAPRQKIKAVPYAIQTEFANEATIATTASTANGLSISGSSIGDVLAFNGGSWSWSKSISVNGNGSASIGTDLVAPTNGLKVSGDSVFDGNLSQSVNKVGLPKYMANVTCLNSSNSIAFNDLTGDNGSITVDSTNTEGYCFVNFPVSLIGRFFFVSAVDNDGDNSSCAISSNNSNQLQCQYVTREGTYSGGSFMIMVY